MAYQRCRPRQVPEEFLKCFDIIEELKDRGKIDEIDERQAWRSILVAAVRQVGQNSDRAVKADKMVDEALPREKEG